ncbi:NAD(P)-dependent alcohol dehydrogenase [Kineosporia rhizophila]|uniref:NAD(P)-dependent alcohol dehydrogenase n=1 Tax=Kineosporia rhizophila TaxID=84633 RepID=UPI001E42CCB4|nr:NAD(P)-dependent alcohol dehydrogenase [Kineosporia rhizophila]MCE0539418.1 NAD(P)-dependent alcohol dehydrogenase [Kineosporia rhizophila]
MKAIVQERFGPPESLRLEDVGEPVPGEGQVLVRVRAAALNPADWHLLRGSPVIARPGMGGRRPRNRVAGLDAAGVVERVGPGVSGVETGDEVYGFVAGAFAEYAVADVTKIAPKPVALSFAEAAALPVAATTALRGIRDIAGVRAGQRVLVTGASGGVGHFAVQVAVALGAEVTAECSAANADLARELGAAQVLDYRASDFTAAPERYDAILYNAGAKAPRIVLKALTPTGTLVLNDGGTPGGFFGPIGPMLRGVVLNWFVGPRITLLPTREHRDDLLEVNRLITEGRLRPVISRTYALPETARALTELEQGHTRGKAVIEVP